MNKRTNMMDELSAILPTFAPDPRPQIPGLFFNEEELKETRPDDYIILAYSHRMPSATNRLGSFAYWSVSIYVKADSIIPIDEYGNKVRQLINRVGYEVTSAETGDYFDTTLDRFRLQIEYRIPQGGHF